MLHLSNIQAGYGGLPIIQNVDLIVKPGENLCILGPNGCGKTTLLKALAQLIPSQGEMVWDGQNLRNLNRKQLAGKVAYMSQTFETPFSYTVEEAVMLGRYRHLGRSLFGSGPKASDKAAVAHWLQKTRLWELRDKFLDELSGGQLQRVYLARALVQEPEILMLDEPANHLDIKHQLELVDYLREWSADGNRLVIGVFHDLNLALRLSENLLFLKDGQVAGQGAASQLLGASFLKRVYGADIAGYMLESFGRWEKLLATIGD